MLRWSSFSRGKSSRGAKFVNLAAYLEPVFQIGLLLDGAMGRQDILGEGLRFWNALLDSRTRAVSSVLTPRIEN